MFLNMFNLGYICFNGENNCNLVLVYIKPNDIFNIKKLCWLFCLIFIIDVKYMHAMHFQEASPDPLEAF